MIAGASARRTKTEKRARSISATALDVASVLDGSGPQRNGDRVRIVSQLVDGATGEQLWAETFERDISDIFSHAVRGVAPDRAGAAGQLTPVDDARLSRARGHDYEAYNLYQKGRQAVGAQDRGEPQTSVQLHQAAIRRDPGYALAYTGLADAYTSLGTYGYLPREEAFAGSAAAAEKAVALDDSLAEAHASLGYAHKNRFEWQAAEKQLPARNRAGSRGWCTRITGTRST